MESASDNYTSKVIEAEDLWLLDVVDTNGYLCWGAELRCDPAPEYVLIITKNNQPLTNKKNQVALHIQAPKMLRGIH